MGPRDRGTIALVIGLGIMGFIVPLFVMPPPMLSLQNWETVFLYTILLLITYFFPIRLGEQTVDLSFGVVFPLFISSGVSITMIALLLTWLISQLIRSRTAFILRLSLKASVVILTFSGGVLIYHLLGGYVLSSAIWLHPLRFMVLPAIGFFGATLGLGFILTVRFSRISRGRDSASWTFGTWWDLVSGVMEYASAMLFLVISYFYGLMGIGYSAILFAGIVYVFRLYSDLMVSNRQLAAIHELSVGLSDCLREDMLVQRFVDSLPNIVSSTVSVVFVPELQGFWAARAVSGNSPEVEEQVRTLRLGPECEKIMTQLMKGKAIVRSQPPRLQGNAPCPLYDSGLGMSFLIVPIWYQEQMLGVLSLIHVDRFAFTERDAAMVQILANHVAVTWWNARQFMETHQQSLIDSLTGLYNYRYFETIIDRYCQRADSAGEQVTLLVLDLDFFKNVNDCHGHLAGNEVLRMVARVLKEQVREEDIVCRYGGEEFTVILPGAGLEEGLQIAERLRRAVEATPVPIPAFGNTSVLPLHVTVSIGATTYPDYADSPLNLMRNADRAMYMGSKQNGRNRVGVYRKAMAP